MCQITSHLNTALSDRYAIEYELGAGGMAPVHLAEDLKHKRKVAVKVLRPELAVVYGWRPHILTQDFDSLVRDLEA